jgi:hypothetical protein
VQVKVETVSVCGLSADRVGPVPISDSVVVGTMAGATTEGGAQQVRHTSVWRQRGASSGQAFWVEMLLEEWDTGGDDHSVDMHNRGKRGLGRSSQRASTGGLGASRRGLVAGGGQPETGVAARPGVVSAEQ